MDNNTFSKVCIFKSLNGYTYDGDHTTKSIRLNNNKIKDNEELMVILNHTLLHS
jgi:hypothetical protein